MRLLGPSFAVICAAYLNATCGFAQGVDQHQAEEKLDPYNKHHDLHHGHQHTYPDRGAIFREVPRGAIPINYAGLSYRFHDGVWFEPRGPAFIVVAPPIGVVVPSLPAFATPVEKSGETYLYANDVYYRARPDLGGYEVVNDPVETAAAADAAADAPPTGAPPAGTPLPTVSTTVAALPVTTAGPASATPVAQSAATAPTALTTPGALTTSTVRAEQTVATAAPTVRAEQTAPTAPAAPAAPNALTAPVAVASSTAPSAANSSLQVSTPRGNRVFAYPRNGQSPQQQASDQYECYRFGVAQSGFDPMVSNGAPSSQTGKRQSDFERAQAACFDGRGYTVR
jgi:hypothetical protein